jgi:hypothetical protein
MLLFVLCRRTLWARSTNYCIPAVPDATLPDAAPEALCLESPGRIGRGSEEGSFPGETGD